MQITTSSNTAIKCEVVLLHLSTDVLTVISYFKMDRIIEI